MKVSRSDSALVLGIIAIVASGGLDGWGLSIGLAGLGLVLLAVLLGR